MAKLSIWSAPTLSPLWILVSVDLIQKWRQVAHSKNLFRLAVIRLFFVAIDQLRLADIFAFCRSPDQFEGIDVAALSFAILDLLFALIFSFFTRQVAHHGNLAVQPHVLLAVIKREAARFEWIHHVLA